MLIQNPTDSKQPDPAQLLKTETREYVPNAYRSYYYYQFRTPPFSLRYVDSMCADPHLALGLQLLKGPIMAKARFYIDCKNHAVKEFLKTNLSRFWRNSAFRALRCIEWGYSPHEVLYREEGGQPADRGSRDRCPAASVSRRPLPCEMKQQPLPIPAGGKHKGVAEQLAHLVRVQSSIEIEVHGRRVEQRRGGEARQTEDDGMCRRISPLAT